MKYNVLEEGSSEVVIEKSRFIGIIKPVKTEEEAISFINAKKKEYWDARHNCMAYIIGEDSAIKRFSDDGEPQGTAGKPILDVLERNNITDAVIVVTRYFGGVLLGTGGLVRAYTKAAADALNNAKVSKKNEGRLIEFKTDYNCAGKIQYLIKQMDAIEMGITYEDMVIMEICIPKEIENDFISKLTEITSGKLDFSKDKYIRYNQCDGKVWIKQ